MSKKWFFVIMDGHHQNRGIDILEEGNVFPCTEESLRGCCDMWHDVVSIQHAVIVTLSKVANTSTDILWKDTSFVDSVKALVNYAGAFERMSGQTSR